MQNVICLHPTFWTTIQMSHRERYSLCEPKNVLKIHPFKFFFNFSLPHFIATNEGDKISVFFNELERNGLVTTWLCLKL